jgi:hypothetical protein
VLTFPLGNHPNQKYWTIVDVAGLGCEYNYLGQVLNQMLSRVRTAAVHQFVSNQLPTSLVGSSFLKSRQAIYL